MQIMAELFSSDLINIFTMMDGRQSYEELLDSFANKLKLSFYEDWAKDQVDLPEYHDIPLPGTFLIFVVNQYREGNIGTAGQMGFLHALESLNRKLAENGKKYKIAQPPVRSEGRGDANPDPTKRDWMIKIIEDKEEMEDNEGREEQENNDDEEEEESSDEEDEDGKPRVLSLHNDVWRKMFDVIVDPIVAHCRNILATNEMKDTKYIFLVGGFANSKYFQMRMQSEFGKRKGLSVEIPDLPSLCVVDGAARYGLSTNFVKIRRMPKTYGCSISKAKYSLNAAQFPKDHIEKHEYHSLNHGSLYVRDCFDIYKRIGEDVKLDSKPVVKTVKKGNPSALSSTTKIYCCTKRNPVTVLEEGCKLLGTVTVPMEKDEKRTTIEFRFSNTTITVFKYPKGKEEQKQKCVIKYV